MLLSIRKLFIVLYLCMAGHLFAQTAGDYRSAATGNWNIPANWETFDGTSWVPALIPPAVSSGTVTIRNGHTLSVTLLTVIDELIVENGGVLIIAPGVGVNVVVSQTIIAEGGMINWVDGNCVIDNGSAGADLIVNGTFWDNRNSALVSIIFNLGATWEMGADGTLLRSCGNSSNNWQTFYEGGIANIPATSNWILRKTNAQNPTLTATIPITGSFYPNLILENNTALPWVVSYTGTSIHATIKGNLDIGGTGTGTGAIALNNNNTHIIPTQIGGDFVLRAGHIFQNYGTGIDVNGNIIVDGTVLYDNNDSRRITCVGPNSQFISGTGVFNIFNFNLDKTGGDVVLNRSIVIDNVFTFVTGIMYSNGAAFPTLNVNASVTGANDASFVSGPIRYIGYDALTFPTGKGSRYRPIGISAGGGPTTFWNEPFTNGCSSGCAATAFSSFNGAWTLTDNSPATDLCGFPTSPNAWYVSGSECGNTVGTCGSNCGSVDPSLHVGSTTAGDMGATYDTGGWCDLGLGGLGAGTETDIRIESPVINCTPHSSIILTFNYIENGQGSTDNATLWYFDGTTWAQIADMAKTSIGCGGQGIWTQFSISLPASANGNPNVRIGFRWVNNDDATGIDPSFAVDDIALMVAGPVSDFTAEYFDFNPQLPYGNVLAPSLASISSCEYWNLVRNAGSISKNVTLSWDEISCDLPTNPADLRVARHDGISMWHNEGNIVFTGTIIIGGTITSNFISFFGIFTLGIHIIVLPIELVQFDAIPNGQDVDISWTTASETNNDYFTIERSQDGQEFTFLKEVDGAGNSTSPKNYLVKDKNPLPGTSYYRLKQTDFNGQYSYSEIRSVEFNGENTLHINYVTGLNNEVLVSYSSEENDALNLRIFDAAGRQVYTSSAPSGLRQMNINGFHGKGMYMLHLTNGVKTDVKKFVVE